MGMSSANDYYRSHCRLPTCHMPAKLKGRTRVEPWINFQHGERIRRAIKLDFQRRNEAARNRKGRGVVERTLVEFTLIKKKSTLKKIKHLLQARRKGYRNTNYNEIKAVDSTWPNRPCLGFQFLTC